MKISVVIITYNRKEEIAQTIKSYEQQTYPDKEIIVIDNASTDGTREMMRSDFPHIDYMWLPENFDIRSINIGVERSTGDIIWRTDDDARPESDDALGRVAGIMAEHPDIHIISMENIEVKSGNQITKWYPFEVDRQKVPPRGYPASAFHGTGAAIRREVFDRIGGFWEFGFEEIDFSARALIAGFNIRYFPNIRMLHFNTPNPGFRSNRWLKLTNQLVRYQWKYFPFFRAAYRCTAVFLVQLLVGIMGRVSIGAMAEAFFSAPATMIHTFRNERMVPSREKLAEITMGRSINHDLGRFFRDVAGRIKYKFRKK